MGRVFAVGRELRTRMRERHIEIVHSNANYDRTCASIAAAWTPARHIAGIHSTHSIQHNITHLVRNRYGTSHFITDADAGKDVLVREDGIPPARITTVPIGIEGDDAATRAAARESTRRSLGIPDDAVVIGNVARLVPFKGHRHLLEAASRVLRSHPRALFLIVGDGELEGELAARAEALGITKRVRFLGFRDDLHTLYPAFDIYSHSSLELAAEMFPIAILRALAAALPVVCTRVGGIAAMVDDGRSGLLIPPGDPEGLAAGLERVAGDADLRRTMGAASLDLFERNYHAAMMAEKVERVYLQHVQHQR
jgi:glycosyltransferase involved in cell wall biosynthesis